MTWCEGGGHLPLDSLSWAAEYNREVQAGSRTLKSLGRVAIGCALVEHGDLTFSVRSLAPPIPSPLPLGIS